VGKRGLGGRAGCDGGGCSGAGGPDPGRVASRLAFLVPSRRQGNRRLDHGAVAGLARDADASAHEVHQRFRDGHPQAGAGVDGADVVFFLRKGLKEPRQLLGVHAPAGVRHGERQEGRARDSGLRGLLAIPGRQLHAPAGHVVAHSVVQHVHDDLPHERWAAQIGFLELGR